MVRPVMKAKFLVLSAVALLAVSVIVGVYMPALGGQDRRRGAILIDELRAMWPPDAGLGDDVALGDSVDLFPARSQLPGDLWLLPDAGAPMLRLALVNDGTRTVGSALLRADKSGAWRVEEVATGVYEFAEYQRAIALAKHSIAQDHLESRIIRTPGWSVVIVRSSKRTAAVFCNVLPGGWIRNPDAKSVEPPTQTVLEPSEALDWVRRLRSGTTSPN